MAELAKAYLMDKLTSAGTAVTPTALGGETSKYENNLIKGGKKNKKSMKKLVKGGNNDDVEMKNDVEMKDKDVEMKDKDVEM